MNKLIRLYVRVDHHELKRDWLLPEKVNFIVDPSHGSSYRTINPREGSGNFYRVVWGGGFVVKHPNLISSEHEECFT